MPRRTLAPPTDPESAFLGTGWSFPPTFSRAELAVVMVSADLDIQQSLRVLFSTAMGERIMVPSYGSQLGTKVFASLTRSLATEIEDDVRTAILYWEPRVEVLDVEVREDPVQKALLLIRVDYLVRQTNTRSNLVFPFYLLEGTLPAQLP